MSDYLTEHGTRETPQGEPARADQVENSAGGFVFAVDDWTRLRRFLILGSEGGSYYANERDLTLENVGVVRRLAETDGAALVAEVVEVSAAGRAPKNDPALYALAVAISHGDRLTVRAAAEALPLVARTATHLFHFVAYAETMRGWGRALRWAVGNWYQSKTPDGLAYQAVKYRQRDGWSHRDLLRLAHPDGSPEQQRLYSAIVSDFGPVNGAGEANPYVLSDLVPRIVRGFVHAQASDSASDTAELIREYRLPWECVRSEQRTDPDVLRALLDVGMGTTTLIRNLANLTRHGVLVGEYRDKVVSQLLDPETIRRSRVHPLQILLGLATYASGRGLRGDNVWHPDSAVASALEDAFYLAFGNVEATGKQILQAVDISGSMCSGQVAGTPLTPREAAAALALVAVQTEPYVDTVTFSNGPSAWIGNERGRFAGFGDGLEPLTLTKRSGLSAVVSEMSQRRMGGTDCALPMLYATAAEREYDCFTIFTDSETWAGNVHPYQALKQYRDRSGIPARLVVVGMVSNGFSIADPKDAGMLDVVGFDSATPGLITDFIRGNV